MDPNVKVIDYIKNTAEYVRTEEGLVSASSMLERFLFPASMQYSTLGKLSGGEKRRLNLLRVLMESPNVLVLDEPTNDLDTRTLTILEDYLDNYDGIVITVSHDRYFLDRVVRRIFAFEGNGKLRQYEGGYTEYINRVREEGSLQDVAIVSGPGSTGAGGTGTGKKAAGAEQILTGADTPGGKQDSRATWKQEKKLKFSYKEEREYATIESDIEVLEKKLEELDTKMLEVASDFGKLNALTKEKEEVEAQLLEKMERWEYLEDLAEKIANQ